MVKCIPHKTASMVMYVFCWLANFEATATPRLHRRELLGSKNHREPARYILETTSADVSYLGCAQ